MFKKTATIIAASSIAIMSSVSMASETDLVVSGVFHGSENLDGKIVKLKLSYDSSTKSEYEGDQFRGDYRIGIGSEAASLMVEIGDKSYYPDIPYGSNPELQITVEN